MRRLWSDIDHARDNLGLGPEAMELPSSWSVTGLVGYATGLALDAAGAVASGAADMARAWARALPGPRCLVDAARRLPLVGALFG